LCIYDEWTKRKEINRIAIAAIPATGKPGRRLWNAVVDWNARKSVQCGNAAIKLPKLRDVVGKLQSWETSLQKLDIISPTAHLLVFCPFQLQIPVKAAFGYSANAGWELSNCSVHFPTRLMDAYGSPP
jgi:hypothetical protein